MFASAAAAVTMTLQACASPAGNGAAATPAPEVVSVHELNVNPGKYDGKRVQVTGYFLWHTDTHKMWNSKKELDARLAFERAHPDDDEPQLECVTVDHRDFSRQRFLYKPQTITVVGEFEAGPNDGKVQVILSNCGPPYHIIWNAHLVK